MIDNPPIITSGSGDLAILSQDIIKNSYKLNGVLEKYEMNNVFMTGLTRYSYVAGILPNFPQDIANQSIIGHIGPEIGLLLDLNNKRNVTAFAGTDS